MTRQRTRRSTRPLDRQRLEALAVHYVGRYATTRAKLIQYLQRKLRERGWEGDEAADPGAIAARLEGLGYVDDSAFALAKASAHGARGLGERRLSLSLRSAGVAEADCAEALALAGAGAVDSALRLAERRRLGPFAAAAPESPREREKALATLVRGGHGFDLARAIIALRPGDDEGVADIRHRFAPTDE